MPAAAVLNGREGRGRPEDAGSKPALLASESATVDSVSLVDDMPPLWPDESAESEFRAEARARGETVAAPPPREPAADESDGKALPSLDELVKRIPADVREMLDDLFRARFVTVKRVPKSALKS